MKRLLTLALAALLVCSFMVPAAFANPMFRKKADNFVVLMDTSGSMAAEYENSGQTKLQMAKRVLNNMNDNIPDLGYNAALYEFTPELKAYQTMQPWSQSGFASTIDSIPNEVEGGYFAGSSTPIAKAIRGLDSILEGTEGRTVVYLFSDGNPNEKDVNFYRLAKKIDDKYNVCFLVINLSPFDEGTEPLRDIANVNSCSDMVNFDEAIASPEVCTGQLCAVIPGDMADDDNDGVANDVDLCPGTPQGVAVDEFGCPFVMSMQVPNVEFGFDKSEIRDEYKRELDELGSFLASHPEGIAILMGFTDATGPDEYNMGLSKRRSMAVKNYLMDNYNLQSDQVQMRWYGEKYPIASNDTMKGRAMNRRVEVRVTGALMRK